MDDSQPQMDTYDTPQLDPVDEDLGDDDDSDDEEKALGRLSEVNRRLIKTELLAVQKRAKEVAAQTGLSTSQVFNHWTSASRRKHTKLNTWNLYSKYFKANQEKEIARLRTREYISSLIYSTGPDNNCRPQAIPGELVVCIKRLR